MLVKWSINNLAVNGGELSELLKVDLNIRALLEEISNQLEHIVKSILNHILLLGDGFSHCGKVGLGCRTHYNALLSLKLELALLILKVVLGQEPIRQLNVYYLHVVADC